MMEMHVEGGMMTQHLAHKTPPRVPPKPTSKSPPSFVSKVAGGRQQSPSPVRHVKGPTPTPVRYKCCERNKINGEYINSLMLLMCIVLLYLNLHHSCLQTRFSFHQTVRLTHQTCQVPHHDQETGENIYQEFTPRLRTHFNVQQPLSSAVQTHHSYDMTFCSFLA